MASPFRSIRNESRADLIAQVRRNFLAMSDEDFAAFLDGLPTERERAQAAKLRTAALQLAAQ